MVTVPDSTFVSRLPTTACAARAGPAPVPHTPTGRAHTPSHIIERCVRETGIEPALRPSPATTAGLFSVLPVKLLPGVLRLRLVKPQSNVLQSASRGDRTHHRRIMSARRSPARPRGMCCYHVSTPAQRVKYPRLGLNQRPSACDADALPLSYKGIRREPASNGCRAFHGGVPNPVPCLRTVHRPSVSLERQGHGIEP